MTLQVPLKFSDEDGSYTQTLRQDALTKYGGRCFCCGEWRKQFLAIHHVKGGGNSERRRIGVTNQFLIHLKRQGWPEGYAVACHNCNMAVHCYGVCPHQGISSLQKGIASDVMFRLKIDVFPVTQSLCTINCRLKKKGLRKCAACGHTKPLQEFRRKRPHIYVCDKCPVSSPLGSHQERYARKLRVQVISKYGGRCACCGEGAWEFLSIDHPHGGGNQHRKSIGRGSGYHFYEWLRSKGWPEGYRILCYNCNCAGGFYGRCHTGIIFNDSPSPLKICG